jgi:hypothetical protein
MSSTSRPLAPLISFALQGLQRCWMPELGRYSYRHRLDSQQPPNESLPELDTFYTLNVLLGCSQIQTAKELSIDIPAVYQSCCDEAGKLRWRTYTYGMALWAGAKLGFAPPAKLIDEVNNLLGNQRRLQTLTAQDVGMLASGAVAMTIAEGGRWRALADLFADRIRYLHHHKQTNLYFNSGAGLRRSFSSFASQVYSILALYHYGEAFDCDWALQMANRSVSRLIALQGRHGEWGWFYYAPGGRVVDFYEVYSVHQHGMAPAFLHHAVAHGVPGARDALIKGFRWLFGDNEMALPMLRPKEHMFYRSQVRQGELRSTLPRMRRSIFNALSNRTDTAQRHHGLVLRRECRSYELAWILWSFGAQTGYPELTSHPDFR